MNHDQLYFRDGVASGVFYCGKCRRVYVVESDADACCKLLVCDCGKRRDRGLSKCFDCTRAAIDERERARFDNAPKLCVDDYQGRLVCIDGDRYMSVDDLEDYAHELLSDHIAEGGKPWTWSPPRVYATTETQPMLDVEGALDNALDDAYEDALSDVGKEAIRELTEYVDAWSRAHLPHVYYEDSKLALAPWPV